MKRMAKMLLSGTFIFLIAGCNVYHSGSVSVEEAVESDSRVKVVTTDNVFYEFKKLKRENGELVGVTGKNSDTAKGLTGNQQTQEGNNVKIVLEERDIRAVYPKNKKMTNIVNFGVPLVGAAGILGITAEGFRPDIGN